VRPAGAPFNRSGDVIRISIHAVGRLKAGPERDLVARYLDRGRKAGRGLGIRDIAVHEIPEARAGRAEERKAGEAAALVGALPPACHLIALDERGAAWSSEEFATRLRGLADRGLGDLAFAIGGADGHGAELLDRADDRLRLGVMTWPHQLVRIMLAEQIYRAVTILSGHPYHRA